MTLLAVLRLSRPVRCITPWLAAWVVSVAAAQGRIQVPAVPVQLKSMATIFELDGVIQPVKQSTASAQASGHIARLLVKAGDKVMAEQLLVTIDHREAQPGLQRSQAEVAQAQAGLRNAQTNFNRT
jgi:multidrug efflux pump subunit AcrA (membrane-fusion protein)